MPLPHDAVSYWAVHIHPDCRKIGHLEFGVLSLSSSDALDEKLQDTTPFVSDACSGWQGWHHRAILIDCGRFVDQYRQCILRPNDCLMFRFDSTAGRLLIFHQRTRRKRLLSIFGPCEHEDAERIELGPDYHHVPQEQRFDHD